MPRRDTPRRLPNPGATLRLCGLRLGTARNNTGRGAGRVVGCGAGRGVGRGVGRGAGGGKERGTLVTVPRDCQG